MSQYLIDQVRRYRMLMGVHTQVVGVEADDRLRAVTLRSGDGTEPVWSPADALLICIGGAPRTNGAAGIELVTNTAGYLVKPAVMSPASQAATGAADGAAAAGDQSARCFRRG